MKKQEYNWKIKVENGSKIMLGTYYKDDKKIVNEKNKKIIKKCWLKNEKRV